LLPRKHADLGARRQHRGLHGDRIARRVGKGGRGERGPARPVSRRAHADAGDSARVRTADQASRITRASGPPLRTYGLSVRAKRSNLASLAHAFGAEIASSATDLGFTRDRQTYNAQVGQARLACAPRNDAENFTGSRAGRGSAGALPHASLRAKRSNLASLVHALAAEIASSRFALL